MTYTEKELKAAMTQDSLVKIHFGDGERGWAHSLGDGLALIANEPLEERLHFMDVVRLDGSVERQRAGEVVFRTYPRRVWIAYFYETEEQGRARYRAIGDACVAAGLWRPEGLIPGNCIVSVPEGADVEKILTEALPDEPVVVIDEKTGEEVSVPWFLVRELEVS